MLSAGELAVGHKHIPQRTCVGCRQVKSKREIVRVVRVPDGWVEIDETGKKSGRGAYVCRLTFCWGKAVDRGGLERALRVSLSLEDRQRLQSFVDSLASEKSLQESVPELSGVTESA